MTKTLTDRIIANGIIDTRNYRYITVDGRRSDKGYYGNNAAILRLPIAALDTTAAIGGWELVKAI